MNRYQILDLILEFSYSQGCWGRLLRDLMDLKKNDPERFEDVMSEWESMDFQSNLDCLMFLEGN